MEWIFISSTRLHSFSKVILLSMLCYSHGHYVRTSCQGKDKVCEFSLTISNVMSMMARDEFGTDSPVVIYSNGTAVKRTGCNVVEDLSKEELADIITVDGYYKPMLAVNGQIPAPPIVVHEGQEVVVNVTNQLLNEALTMHFHGQHQRGTPWMDGTGGVSQCALQPGQTFTHRFYANPVGTFWYHAHQGVLRSEGLYGAFIVLPSKETENKNRGDDPLPAISDDFYLVIQDFFHQSSVEVFNQVKSVLGTYALNGYDAIEESCAPPTFHVDGSLNGLVPINALLINGKGRSYERGSDEARNPGLPLERIRVRKGNEYRFRIIQASQIQTLRISIDSHKLNVVSSDGSDIKTTTVDSIIIAPAERYDFWISATDPEHSGMYWIRVETIEWANGNSSEDASGWHEVNHVKAILEYEHTENHQGNSGKANNGIMSEPKSRRRKCTLFHPCVLLNCPFKYFPLGEHLRCLVLTDLRKPVLNPTYTPTNLQRFTEKFLKLNISQFGAGFNGKQFLLPPAPLQIYPSPENQGRPCPDVCDQPVGLCTCTHVVHIPLGHVIQIILSSGGGTHPVHLHGHYFQVVKIGYPEYDRNTGKQLGANTDTTCKDELCNELEWADARWKGGNVPDILQEGAIEKDTVSVPAGGYVVVRFISDNPGFWFMHCHMEVNNRMGLALIIKEGEVDEMPPPPEGFPQCGDFSWSSEEFRKKVKPPMAQQLGVKMKPSESPSRTKDIVIAVLLGVLGLMLTAFAILELRRRRAHKGYSFVPSGEQIKSYGTNQM